MFFPCRKRIFFVLEGQKIDFFAPHGELKSTFWPASRKKNYFILLIVTLASHSQNKPFFPLVAEFSVSTCFYPKLIKFSFEHLGNSEEDKYGRR